MAYGLNAFYLAPTYVKGNIQAEGIFDNVAYSYKTQHVPVYAATKAFIKTNSSKYDLTFDAGIGPNFMRIGSYKEVTQSNSEAMDNFKSNNDVTFSLTLGAGVQFNNVIGKLPLECGYRFYYLGEGQLTANNTLFTNTLKTGDIYANALVCAVTI